MSVSDAPRALALLLLFVSAALLHGADQSRGRSRLALLSSATRVHSARIAAFLAVELAVASWARAEAGPAACLVAAATLMVFASTVAIVAPLVPRGLWTSVAGAALVAGVLLVFGGVW